MKRKGRPVNRREKRIVPVVSMYHTLQGVLEIARIIPNTTRFKSELEINQGGRGPLPSWRPSSPANLVLFCFRGGIPSSP